MSSGRILTPWLASMLVGQGCVVDGRAVCWKKLHPESSTGHLFWGERKYYNRFVPRRSLIRNILSVLLRWSLDVRVTYGGCTYRSSGF